MKKLTLFFVAMTMSLFSFAQTQMSGTYTVGTGGSYDYSSMADAGMAIKEAEFTGDVTLLICTDLTETINTGIVNKSEYTLTIRPDKDENRTITYTTATDNTGPTGVFVIGGDMTKTPGSTIGWASIPTKNVVVDGAAEGKTTPRLKITTGKFGTGFLIYGDVQDCVVKNCILENTGTATANYALTFRSEKYSSTSKNIGPKNCLVENCVLEATHATKSQTIYFNGSQANSAAGYPANITIRNCNIKAHTRGMFLYGVNGLNVEGCTFDLSDMASGLMCHGILGNTVKGTINVKGNKFIKNSTKNTYAGEYGLQTITASGGATLWVIENNYFAGYNAVASGTTTKESRLVGIRCGDPCEIRHNTFYMPKLTYAPATPLVSTHAVALLWLAGSHKYPVQNNIFVCEETTANVSLIRGGLNENVTGNVFYHKGGNAAIVAAAPSCMTFADLETSYPAQAATSKWTNVTFADAANGDLSLAGSSDGDLNLAVDRLAEVLTDINGTARREKTYAGAYEGSEFPAEVCSVTTMVVPVDGGTVEGGGDYAKGASVTLTATSNDHYEFTGWTGDVESTDNPLTITVDGNKNITANFAKKQYTLTVFVNDENKGTIDVATGSHEYGTEVTLTATPKPGYKLLAWSNKATTPSITLTMDNNKAVSAYFVKEYATDPTFTIEKVWENTNVPAATANGFQGVGWDQKIYIKDRLGAAINVYTETGSELYAQLGATVTGLAGDQPIAVDDAGNLVVRSGSTNFYDSPTQVSIFRKNENTPEVIDFTLPATGRCDFISASGDIFSEKGGYVYFFCMNQTTVSRLHIKNGEYEGVDTIAIVAEEGKAASQSHVVVDIYGNIHTSSKGKNAYEYNITTLTTTADSYLGAATKKTPKSTIGGCTFELGGKELWAYVAGTTNYSSEWELKNVTDGVLVSADVLYAKDKTTVNSNPVANWLNVQVVDEKTAYIYQFCPTVAAAVWKVSFTENYTVSATANPVAGGTVIGTGAYQEGATATLTATPNTGYKFVNWTKGGEVVSTDATYSFPVTENVELVANFEAIASKDPRAWAYDMKLGEEGDNYTFTFKATTAGQATITFNDKDGNALAQPASQTMAAVLGENKFTIAKNAFAAGVDAFWSITIDGAPIEGVVEVTDQSRGIYDFYNMMGVVVDNNTDSKDFGKIYIQQSYQRSYASSSTSNNGITTRANDQTSGIFIYNQALDELNSPSNVGYKPTVPSGYTEIGSSSSAFQRLNIHPKTGNLVFSHAVSGNPAVFAINREDMTGAVTNLLTGVADMTRSVAHCFDAEGMLYVMNFADNKGTVYKVINGEATPFTATSDKFINANITIASDGRGGLWISQNRGQLDDYSPYYYQLVHVSNEGEFDWGVDYQTPHGLEGSSSRGALAYDVERKILAQGRNGKVELYTVSYEPTITLTPLYTIASDDLGNNIDGLAFDYAGDLYVVNSSKEKFQKFALPTDENICTVAAPALEAIRSTPVYTVSVASNNNEWGIANGGGTFEEGQTATITAVAATNYKFVNWTKDEEIVSTETTYSFLVTETATYTANFVEITKYTINATANDPAMGSVIGGGIYYEGTEVTLTAKANGGYVFEKWSDDNTDESRTFTAGVDMPETLTANFKVAVPRAWAYDLRLDADTDPANYIFTFKTTSAGAATLIFKDKDGNTQDFGAHTATATEAGEQTITIAKTVFDAATKDIYWSVELAGEAIAKMAEITDPTKGIYSFYLPQGVAVDNNTDSEYFGRIYLAEANDGGNDGQSDRTKAQKRGIFMFDQKLADLNPTANVGVLPANAATAMTDKTRQAIHRVAVNPTNGQVAFAYNIAGATAVWSMNPNDMTANASNLINGADDITKASSLCFDEDGALYVMNNANTGTIGGQIYKVENGVATLFAAHQAGKQWAVDDNAMAADGRGGLWIVQNRYDYTPYPILTHVNKNGIVDFAVTENLNGWFPNNTTGGASYRGQCAYNAKEDILAFAGNRVVALFKVEYDSNGKPTLTEKLMTTVDLNPDAKGNFYIDGVAFDYAGDLYVASASTERLYKFVIPTNDNTCTVPAPESQIIQKEARYTVTVEVNSPTMGTAIGGGTDFLAGDIATLSATANDGYQFVNWTKDGVEVSTETSFDYIVPAENVTLFANFDVKPMEIVGTVKRAVQIGESVVVLTHENNGTPHLYKVVDGVLEAEISQEGVIARDPDNAGDYLSISDIAATEDGKLIAINKMVCQFDADQVATGYKRGETRVYIWNDLASNPITWFTSAQSSNWYKSIQGHTMAVKGTSSNATVFVTGMNQTNGKSRYSIYTIKDGIYNGEANNNNDYYHYTKKDAITPSTLGENYELNASPLGTDTWILDGGLVDPFEITDPLIYNTEVTVGATINDDLGKKFNGATYLTVEGTHLMVAPYAVGENVGGVTVLNISNGFNNASELNYHELGSPEAATAAATAVKVNGDDLTITLVVDNQIHVFTIDLNLQYTRPVTSGDFGTICLPYGSSSYSGAEFYEIAYLELEGDGTTPKGIWLDEVVEPLVAGKPYIFKATSNLLTVNYKGEEALSPVDGKAGLTGTFDGITDETVLQGNYMIADNRFWLCGTGCWLNANRAYIDKNTLHNNTTPVAAIPGRRRVMMGAAGENTTTGVDNLTEDGVVSTNQATKMVVNGQLIIIRDGVKYNAQGVRL